MLENCKKKRRQTDPVDPQTPLLPIGSGVPHDINYYAIKNSGHRSLR